MYADGGGLYLRVTSPDARSWVFRYGRDGKERYMGLGSLNAVSLSEARARAAEARRLTSAGIDPIGARDGQRAAERVEAAKQVTFEAAAEAYIRSHKAGWRNAKHGDQWRNTLKAYVYPVIGALPVNQIDSGLVFKVLEPIWTAKPETASRVRQRIEAVLDAATARGHRSGENPARWRGHLDSLLPARAKVQRVQHHPALPYAEIGAFMADLRKQEGLAARAMELLILTATRTTECIAARWSEFDLGQGLWTIPAERIKAGREHRIPLSPAAVALLRKLAETKVSEFVFPSRPGKPLSNGALLALLTPDEPFGPYCTWLPLHLSRLGGGADQFSARSCRDGAVPCHRGQSGSGLSTRRLAGKATPNDGSMGSIRGYKAGPGQGCDSNATAQRGSVELPRSGIGRPADKRAPHALPHQPRSGAVTGGGMSGKVSLPINQTAAAPAGKGQPKPSKRKARFSGI